MYQYNGSTISHQQQSMAATSGAYSRLYNRYNPTNTTTSINQHQNCQLNGCGTATAANIPSGTVVPACCSNLYNDRGVTRSPVNFREGRRSSDGLMVAQQGIVAFQQKLYHKEKVKFEQKGKKPGGREGTLVLIPKVLLYQILIRWLNNFGNFYRILIVLFIKLSVQTFQPLIVIYRMGNFVYHHWGCTSIYKSLSYPCRILCLPTLLIIILT